jgi:hypothetical protein
VPSVAGQSNRKGSCAGLFDGRYWARTSDPQLVESGQRSRPFAHVRSHAVVKPNGCQSERSSEPERTPILAILATPSTPVPCRRAGRAGNSLHPTPSNDSARVWARRGDRAVEGERLLQLLVGLCALVSPRAASARRVAEYLPPTQGPPLIASWAASANRPSTLARRCGLSPATAADRRALRLGREGACTRPATVTRTLHSHVSRRGRLTGRPLR